MYEVTKREVLFSIIIVFIGSTLGLLISSNIRDFILDKNAEYEKAISISDRDMFTYNMKTGVGNAFVYGDITPSDTVSYSEVQGKYIHISKVTERYTQHTRRVAHKSGKRTYYTTETYWTWDRVDSESKKSKKIKFMDVEFDIDKIDGVISDEYIDTIRTSYYYRDKYYGTPAKKVTGTMYCNLKDDTINNANFFSDYKIEDCREYYMQGNWLIVLFWLVWIALIGGIVYYFCMIDNEWLEG